MNDMANTVISNMLLASSNYIVRENIKSLKTNPVLRILKNQCHIFCHLHEKKNKIFA